MMVKVLNRIFAGLVLLLVGAGAVCAGSFQVNPVRATLSPSQLVSAMTVTNTGTAPVVLQIEVLSWSQQDGQDVYTPTHDIIATPPIFTIPVGASQVVRAGLRHVSDTQRELTYRLFLTEAPESPKSDFQGMQMRLRIGVPVFVLPAIKPLNDVIWKIYRTHEGLLELGLINNGGAHLQVANFKLTDTEGKELVKQDLASYVLPGQSRNWSVKGFTAPGSLSNLRIFAQTDNGNLDSGLIAVESK